MLRRIVLTGVVALGVVIASCGTETEEEPVPQEDEPTATEVQTDPDTETAPGEDGADTPPEEPQATPDPRKYTVRPGDTLGDIAFRFGTTIQVLLELNDIPNPDSLVIGQVLVLPDAVVANPRDGREMVTLVRVIDGDTIEVQLANGSVETVRYIGIDTPETIAPGQPVEPFGPEASSFNADLLSGNIVLLETDISERDRFDRLLRYVWVETEFGELVFVNEELVRAGLAVISTFPPDVKYVELFLAAQNAAQADGLGIWGEPR